MATELDSHIVTLAQSHLDRRNFFRKAGYFGLGAAVAGVTLGAPKAEAQLNSAQVADTIAEIFTAFLIAEDLATTFYYNGLVSAGVIQDVNLAGPGGDYAHVTAQGNFGNVDYLRAALTQEYQHANLFRNLLTHKQIDSTTDPYQTFYFPAGTFDNLANFLGILDALENAFIGAYIVAVQELSYKAAAAATGKLKGGDAAYSAQQYELNAKRFASILGVECEHRVLGRVIGNVNPANNLTFESVDGLTSIYNGSASAVVALTPFLTPSTGPGYSLATANYFIRTVGVASTGSLINF